ncbi:kinetochore-associated Ndc80 complex subunit spc25 [Knufia obscura]|uniref:Kinetochore protein SPC25 n=2 Tax=Knufia TaxID=430999 RepID=A0AAN8FDP0_9EURO|nr:kinetochore-associated Ndc80 complex subunit spc25 [Knufia obscura]KAK5956456.1 kinetochore-associated Ndc80 complex subunit spc25 [Knufia fluminis]
MATTTAHSFNTSQSDFRTSQTHPHAPHSFSYSESPLTQLPTVDFPFDDLRRRMTEFTTKFDAYIERGRKRVLEERNDFRARLSELNEDQKSTSTQISTIQSTLASHTHLQTREAHEKSEMQSQISHLESHASTQRTHRDKLQQAITSTQRQIDAKLSAQREYAAKIDKQSELNGPELAFWETYLGTRIEGGGDEGIIRVFYAFPAERVGSGEKEREATFELHVPETGSGGYEVLHTRPRLEGRDVERVVGRLNETRDIGVLLKGMRGLFQGVLGERMIVQ